ncbi:MAG TPA: DUF3237 family protein [Polyangia bacterium]|nr:DUF3237 family protein [Polyangia bacterium]
MTTPAEAAPRRAFLDWNLLYLFSFDVELDITRQENLGRFPGGTRLNVFSRDDLSRVYNIGRESKLPGNGRPAIAGRIVSGGDRVLIRDDDVGECNVRFRLETDDQAAIDVRVQIFGYLGPGGAGRIVLGKWKSRFGTENHPYEFPIVTSPRFQTTDRRYVWLNDLQGIGFGREVVIESKFRRNTQDIYVLT